MTGENIPRIHTMLKQCSGNVRTAVIHGRLTYGNARDADTGLLSQSGLKEHISVHLRIAAEYNHPLSICMLALDYTKAATMVNLKDLSAHINGFCKGSGIMGRYEQDILSIVFPETSKETALNLVEGLREDIVNDGLRNGQALSISAGVAGFIEDVKDGDSSLHRMALIAFGEAQQVGNRVVGYSPE